MEIRREVELASGVEEVWRLLADVDELAAWVGEELRAARSLVVEPGRRLEWTWAPDGRESHVEVTVEQAGDDRTVVRVVERVAGGGSAMACTLGDRWDDALFGLEVRCLTLRFLAVPA